MSAVNLLATIGAVATALLALGALVVKAGRPIVCVLGMLREFLEDWRGEPERPGVPARPGVMARLGELEKRTAELRPNGGSSLADAVRRIETRVERIEQHHRKETPR